MVNPHVQYVIIRCVFTDFINDKREVRWAQFYGDGSVIFVDNKWDATQTQYSEDKKTLREVSDEMKKVLPGVGARAMYEVVDTRLHTYPCKTCGAQMHAYTCDECGHEDVDALIEDGLFDPDSYKL